MSSSPAASPVTKNRIEEMVTFKSAHSDQLLRESSSQVEDTEVDYMPAVQKCLADLDLKDEYTQLVEERAVMKKRFRTAYVEFTIFFDDVDQDGSEWISESELLSNIDELLDAEKEVNPENVNEMIQYWLEQRPDNWHDNFVKEQAAKLQMQVVKDDEKGGANTYSLHPFVMRATNDQTAMWNRALHREELVSLLMFSYFRRLKPIGQLHSSLTIMKSYKPGVYEEKHNKRAGLGLNFYKGLEVTLRFLWDLLNMVFLPAHLFKARRDLEKVNQSIGEKYFGSLLSGWIVVAALLTFNMILYASNAGDMRKSGKRGNGLTQSEFYFPYFWYMACLVAWNLGRYFSGENGVAYITNRRNADTTRSRVLRQFGLSRPMEYDIQKCSWELGREKFPSALEVYRNIFNISVCGQGLSIVPMPHMIKEEVWMGDKDEHTLRKIAEYHDSLRSRFHAVDVVLAFFMAAAHIIVRAAEDRPIFGEESNAEVFVVLSSFVLTWVLYGGFLMMIGRMCDVLRAYDLCLEVITKLPDRGSTRRLIYNVRSEIDRDADGAEVNFNKIYTNKGVTVPWMPLYELDNLRAWDAIRRHIVDEWQDVLLGYPRGTAVVALLIFVLMSFSLLLSLFVFSSRSGNGFRWSVLSASLFIAMRLSYFLFLGSDVNKNSRKHVEILTEMQLRVLTFVELNEVSEALMEPQIRHRTRLENVSQDLTTMTAQKRMSMLGVSKTGARFQDYAQVLGTFISRIQNSTDHYVSVFGFEVDQELTSKFVSLVWLWFLVALSNFVVTDLNF